MSQHQNQDPSKFTGLRLLGEADRKPEVKEVRNKVVDRTNEFLESLAAEREKEAHSKGGFVLRNAGVIKETDLGTTAHGMKAVGTDYEYGISLTGDGKETPLELQAVVPNVWGEGAEHEGFSVIRMKGTDPMDRLVNGDHNYDSSRKGDVASFRYSDHRGGMEQYSGFTVHGSGEFYQQQFTGEGAHTSHPIRDVETARSAQQHLEDAITLVQRNLAG